MKNFARLFAFLGAFLFTTLFTMPHAQAVSGFQGDVAFKQVVFYKGAAGFGSKAGSSYGNAKAIVDGDILAIEPGMIITKVYVIVDTAITGTSALNVGDDDDNDGFVPTASVTLGTPGMYAWSSENAGAYLKVGTGNAPNAKYYAAAGKEVKLDVTGTNTAGAFRVVIEGYKVGPLQ